MRILCDEIDNWNQESFPNNEDTITHAVEGRLAEFIPANQLWHNNMFAFNGVSSDCKTYRIRGKRVTKEEFFDAVRRESPEFFIWLMFNSSAFS